MLVSVYGIVHCPKCWRLAELRPNYSGRSTTWSRQMAGDTCFCTIDYNLEARNPKLTVVFLPNKLWSIVTAFKWLLEQHKQHCISCT
jgi:hypothetical protein